MPQRPDVAHAEHEAVEHSHAPRYFAVWVALAVLTVVTYLVSRLHLGGGWGMVVALLIAVTKASLVALFFMHLWEQRGANRLVIVTACVFVALLIGLTVLDNATRFPLANPPGSEATPAFPASAAPPGVK
jgi:cytochrome c oxidase subunit 4